MDYFGNRSWMDNRKKCGMLGPTDEYYAGVNAFLDYAYDHPSYVSEGKIRCPCKSCKLGTYLNRDQVSLHLLSKGFWAKYNGMWWAHGEVRIPLAAQVPQNEDNSVYRMNEMIHDAAGPSSFATCSSASTAGSTATSRAPPLSEASAKELVSAIVGREDVLDAIGDAVFSRMTDERLGAILAQRRAMRDQSSQGSGSAQGTPRLGDDP